MYNLSIVTTPMQIINSIEAINHFGLKNNILVIIFKPRQVNNEQLEKIAKLYSWSKIIRVNEGLKKSKYIEYIRLIHRLKKERYNYVFFGNYTSIYKIIISNIRKNNLYLVDDGTATIDIYKSVLLQDKINKFTMKHLRFLLVGLKTKIKDRINLFTYFDLPHDKRFTIVKNNLNYFKDRLDKDAQKEESVFFLGQPLVASHFIRKEVYFASIEAIKKYVQGKIIYIPHRFEKIEDDFKAFEDSDFEIRYLDMPIELYFIYNKIYPNRVISFCTTATFTLEKIYDHLSFESIVIPSQEFLNKQKEFLQCYDTLRDTTRSRFLTFDDLNLKLGSS